MVHLAFSVFGKLLQCLDEFLDALIHKRQNAEKSLDVGLIQCESVSLQKKKQKSSQK